MKGAIILLMSLIEAMLFTGTVMSKDTMGLYTDNNVGNKYPDSWYFVDTISTNRVTVIYDDSIRQCYAFTDSVDVKSIDTPNILLLPNSYIILDVFCRNHGIKELNIANKFLREAYDMTSLESGGMSQHADKYQLTKTLYELEFWRRPKYYIYLLMQGKEIELNCIEAILLYKVPSKIDCNYEAYYRVLIPVWAPFKYRRNGY